MKKSVILALALAGSALMTAPLTAQTSPPAEKPRLAVFGFLNLTEDDSFTVPAETASSNLFITMKMLSLFQVSDLDTVPRNLTDSGLEQWCARNNVDFVIFGTMKLKDDGSQEYRLAYFSHAAQRITASKKESGETVLDVFSVVDSLTDSMLATIVNNKISFGSLAFANSGIAGDYDVYLDGSYIQTNPAKFDRVPSGTHTVRVVQKATGVELVKTEITVAAKKQETVAFALKEPTKAELAAMPKTPDEQIAANVRDIKIAIGNGLDKNFIDISEKARIISDMDKQVIFDANKKKSAAPFFENLLLSPVVPLGSVLQGDVFGSLSVTVLKGGGLAAAAWFMSQYKDKDPGPVGTVFIGGIGAFLVGNVISYIIPFTYATSYNEKLQNALGMRRGLKAKPTVGLSSEGDNLGFRAGIALEM